METNGTMKQIIELLAKAKGMTNKGLKEKVISRGLGVYLIGDATVTRQRCFGGLPGGGKLNHLSPPRIPPLETWELHQ